MLKRLTSLSLTICMVLTLVLNTGFTAVRAEAASGEEYLLYPKPQQITYSDGDYLLRGKLNVIYDHAIDSYTKTRMEETAKLKNLTVQTSDEAQRGMTNVYVGVYGSNGAAADYINKTYAPESSLFDKLDSYFLASKDNVISILAKDTDAAFYAITTLYQVLSQLESLRIRNFTIEDYADVAARGFIEGYYGEPWSVEDRSELMKFGGYYKMNAYFYAPKDDPKHNAKWRELYTPEELENIRIMAEAGNQSKCRYVFALHPFMSNPIRFGTEANYQEDLRIMKAKFKQVIDAGVRQISILADDSNGGGHYENGVYKNDGVNELRVINDMVDWLKEVQTEYPDMKMTLPFVPVAYMNGNGLAQELQKLKEAPDTVQLVMTGGAVWGSVNNNFTSTFKNNVGRGPFMWINWPCSDNSKEHLIMGGTEVFLKAGVDPATLEGIMLNPMQQSEASKEGIFSNAAYAWNIWQSDADALQTWEDSFSFVDHHSPVPTPASDALRELSKHMNHSNIISGKESVALKPMLDAFKTKMSAATLAPEDIAPLIREFEILRDAAITYRQNPGNPRTRDQIIYWLNCWDDTTEAAISYLQALQADLEGNTNEMFSLYSKGKTAFASSRTHKFKYLAEYKYAEVAWEHIVPFIRAMESTLAIKATEIVDPEPTVLTKTYISNVYTSPAIGSIDNLFDWDDSTLVEFRAPLNQTVGDYVGVRFNKPIDVNRIRFAFGGSTNDHLFHTKLEYTTDGITWQNVSKTGEVYNRLAGDKNPIVATGLSLTDVRGIRLTVTQNKENTWVNIKSIDINTQDIEEIKEPYPVSEVTMENAVIADNAYPLKNITDGNKSTEAWLKNASGDSIAANAAVILDLGESRPIGSVLVTQGTSKPSDILNQAVIEYSDTKSSWEKFGDVKNATEQTVTGSATARYIRLRNTEAKNIWWRLAGIDVFEPGKSLGSENLYTNIQTDIMSNATVSEASLTSGEVTLNQNDYIGLKLSNTKELTNISIDADYGADVTLQTSKNAIIWEAADTGVLAEHRDARYIRLINKGSSSVTFQLNTFAVTSNELLPESLYEIVGMGINSAYGSTDMRNQKDAWKIFDGDLSTKAEICDYPKKDAYATFDLGKTVTVNSLRYYINESASNYIRDAEFEIADTPDAASWSHLLTIGDGVENDNTDNKDLNSTAKDYMGEGAYQHDSVNPGNMYREETGQNASGRYLRVRFTAPNTLRFAQFNEILINNGNYTGVENNRDFVGTFEEKGHQPSLMKDTDLSTTYKPSLPNGSMTYNMSEPVGIKGVRIISSGVASNAEVKAEFIDAANISAGSKTVTVGTLSQTLFDFNVPEGKTLLGITLEWKDNLPEISEIVTVKGGFGGSIVDKSSLEELMNTMENESWTKSSKRAVAAAKAVAQGILDSAYVSQTTVDSTWAALQKAISDAAEKVQTTKLRELQNLVDGKESQNGTIGEETVEIYNTKSYAPYAMAINEAAAALVDTDDLAEEEAQRLITAIAEAKTALAYSPVQRELAQAALEDPDSFDEKVYTSSSWKNYKQAQETLQSKLNADPDGKVNPAIYAQLRIDRENAIAGLTHNADQLETYRKGLKLLAAETYTEASYKPYKAAYDALMALQIGNTAIDVFENLRSAFEAALKNLKPQDHSIVEVTGITVTGSLTVAKGAVKTLKAAVTPSNASNQTLIWTSSDAKVATVDQNGNVKGMKAGTASITVKTMNGKMASCKVTVAEVKLNAASMPLKKGQSSSALRISSKYPANDKVASWTSSNKRIAKVDKKGKITGLNNGKTTITVTMKSGAKASCKVTVQKKKVVTKSIKLSKKSLRLTTGKKLTLSILRKPISGTEKITWTTSSKKVATVNKNGKVTAKAPGKTVITARTSNKKMAKCTIYVSKR